MHPKASAEAKTAAEDIQWVLETIDSLLVGKSMQVRLAIACLLADGHLLIEDVPGVGKTTLAQTIAATLGLQTNRLQFTSDLLPADITGISVFDNQSHCFRFHSGPIFTELLLADEINRAPPKTQSALLEAMEEGRVSVDGTSYDIGKPMFVIATQNPLDQLGVYPLPESQLDRFLITIELGYPSEDAERALLAGENRRELIDKLDPLVNTDRVLFWQARARQLHTSAAVIDYIQRLLSSSRRLADSQGGTMGLSPRAGLGLLAMSRAWALLQRREMVLPDDVQAVFPYVAAHRMAGSLRSGYATAREILDQVNAH